MPALDLQKVAACLRDLEELFKQAGISHHPALITFRCVDPRHNNRTIISTTRQHAFAQWIGEDDVNRLIDWYGMKEFNCAANELVKNFDATSLGGRYSFDNPSLIKFAMNPGVREAGIRLQRIYATDHEDNLCMAALHGNRMNWQEAINRILADLSILGYPGQVEIYTGRIQTHGSRPTDLKLSARYNGPNTSWELISLPSG